MLRCLFSFVTFFVFPFSDFCSLVLGGPRPSKTTKMHCTIAWPCVCFCLHVRTASQSQLRPSTLPQFQSTALQELILASSFGARLLVLSFPGARLTSFLSLLFGRTSIGAPWSARGPFPALFSTQRHGQEGGHEEAWRPRGDSRVRCGHAEREGDSLPLSGLEFQPLQPPEAPEWLCVVTASVLTKASGLNCALVSWRRGCLA